MPRRRKPARLWLRRARGDRNAVWVILDGGKQVATGCSESELGRAQEALADHIAQSYRPPASRVLRELHVEDVMTVYLREHAPTVARPDFIATTAKPILEWWAGKRLSEIRGQSCRDYVEWRSKSVSVSTARHDLKTLRAAINHYHREHGPLDAVPVVTVPSAAEPRQRWLTRDEAARLIKAARRIGNAHLARFILIGLYTGTRSQAILSLSWLPQTAGGWIDIESQVIYRRGREEKEGKTKRRPTSKLHSRLIPHMMRWKSQDLAAGIVHVVHWERKRVGKLRRSWRNACRAAGLGADVVPHTLRHTAATWQMQSGVPAWEAAGYLGMSEEVLRRVYGHHSPEHQSQAARADGRRR